MDTEPKAYSYIRFSTPKQEKGDSLRRQEKDADRGRPGRMDTMRVLMESLGMSC
jgi:hypothetical protein